MNTIKISFIALFLTITGLSYGQVRIVTTVTNTAAANSSAFIDASSNSSNNTKTNIGKGLLYPRVDLTTFAAFSGTPVGVATSYPTRFDGMVVYNTASGIAGIGGTVVNPGFYYYSNQSVTVGGGKWVRMNDGNVTSTPNGVSFPSSPNPNEGDIFYRTDLKELYFYNGTSWIGASINFSGSLSGDISGTQEATVIGAGKVTNDMLVGSIASSKLIGSDITRIGTLTEGEVPYSLLSGTVPVWNQNTTGNAASATSAISTSITEDLSSSSVVYPTWVTATSGNLQQNVSSTKLNFVPSTGTLSATVFSGSGAGLTNLPTPVLHVTTEQTSNYTALATDDIILYTANTANLTLTLPTTGIPIGKKYYITNAGTEAVNILPQPREMSTMQAQPSQACILMYIGGTGNGSWSIMSGF